MIKNIKLTKKIEKEMKMKNTVRQVPSPWHLTGLVYQNRHHRHRRRLRSVSHNLSSSAIAHRWEGQKNSRTSLHLQVHMEVDRGLLGKWLIWWFLRLLHLALLLFSPPVITQNYKCWERGRFQENVPGPPCHKQTTLHNSRKNETLHVKLLLNIQKKKL